MLHWVKHQLIKKKESNWTSSVVGEECSMLYCCPLHIDEGIDDFIDQHQEPPELFPCCNMGDFDKMIVHQACQYCGEPARYVLMRFSEEKK
jgi:CxxH/CxxC protein (TIGR04129 family)